MPTVCLYLHLHQPYRLRRYNIFDVGNSDEYFDDAKNDQNYEVFHKVTQKSYLPMLSLLKNLL
jgi:alpha-amylase